MKKNGWTFLLAALVAFPLMAQGNSDRPALVVGVTVDGLRDDYLSLFWNECKAGGFERALASGARFTHCAYPYRMAGDLADLVTLQTGADPYLHGIPSDKVYDRKLMRACPVMEDKEVKATQGTARVSAKAIMATTVSDELYENTLGLSKTVSLALDPQMAVAQAGHSGLALWIDNLSGKWAGSTYYRSGLPDWVSGKGLEAYMEKTWQPFYTVSTYEAASGAARKGFSYALKNECKGVKPYETLFTTPFVNTALREMAVRAIEGEGLGKDLYPDVLLVHFSIRPFAHDQRPGLSMELEDAYLRLDYDLSLLMKALDAKVGAGNWLLYFTTSRVAPDYTDALNRRLPSRSFNAERYSGLLNSYLSAVYGSARWVAGQQSGRVYLNRALIEDKNLSLREIQDKAVEFFGLIPGVVDLSTSYQLERDYVSGGGMCYAYTKESGADLYYTLAPGWHEVDMKGNKTGYRAGFSQQCTLSLCGWRVPRAQVSEPVSALDLAATLASWLRIMPPSGCRGAALPVIPR